MTAIAEELDRRMQMLPAERAAAVEQLVRHVLALFDERSAPISAPREFIIRTKDLGLRPGIDPTKLGQLADEL